MKKFGIVAVAFLIVCLLFICTSCTPTDYEQSAMDRNVKIIYAEAVDLGYDGTLEEFLSTIKGTEGVGISDVYIDANGRLFVLLTDDTLLEVGDVKGKDGVDGVGIVDIIKNGNDEIIITLSNGVKKNLGKVTSGKDGINGINGIDGINGVDGKDGVNGTNGKDGVGISSIIRNEDDEIIVTLTDGTIKNLGKVLNGKDGADGKDGTNGVDGKDGVNGKDGADGKNGIDGKDGKDGINGVDGKDGADGKDGINGTDGKDGENGKDGVGIVDIIRNENDEIIVILSDGTTKNLGKVTDGKDGENGKDGNDGLSAYELYLKYHPEYKGTEREWVEEMFGGVKEFTVTVKYGDKQTTVSVKRGDAVDLSGIDVTRDGYAFVKWTTEDGEDFDTSAPISSDTVIVAKYRKVTVYDSVYSDITVENDSVAVINVSADNSAALNGVTFSATSGIIKIKVSYAGSDYEIEHNFADDNSLSNPNLNALLESGVEFSLEITYYGGDGLTVTPEY